jgi:4-amino-4-deoxy-L-arabinose transferase-like glycosyltransferase
VNDSLNIALTIISTVATVVATFVAIFQYAQTASASRKRRERLDLPEHAGSRRHEWVVYPWAQSEQRDDGEEDEGQDAPLRVGYLWLAVACFPWLNFMAWAWLGFRTKRFVFLAFAVMYAVPFAVFFTLREAAKAEAGPAAQMPGWPTAVGVLSWMVGIAHAISLRGEFQQKASRGQSE